MMAFTYHTPQPKTPFRDPNAFEIGVRESLRQRRQSHWGAWVMTVAAILVGAVGGAQLGNWSANGMLQATLPSISDIQPAAGDGAMMDGSLRLQAAGDGKYYADIDFMGQMITVQVDPELSHSILRDGDAALLAGQFKTVGEVTIVPRLALAGLQLTNAAFLRTGDALSFSVIGRDLISQLGAFAVAGAELRIRPAS